MTFRNLLLNHSFTSVFNKLHSLYYYKDPDDEITQIAINYRKTIRELVALPELISLCVINLIFNKSSLSIHSSDPSGKKSSIEEDSWITLIDCEVRTNHKCADTDIIAHLLYELTFNGFSQHSN